MRRLLMLALVALGSLVAVSAPAEERADYYYPPVTSTEIFDRVLTPTPPADRNVRIGFVTQVTQQQLQAPFPARYTLFAKGSDAQELIIMALDDEVFRTLFRARGVMAQLTAPTRTTQFFVENNLSAVATFYDMLKIMGFKLLTLTDGVSWSHQVEFH